MKKLTILHISDAHIQKKDKKEISEIIQKLIADVKMMEMAKNFKIDLVCFTGDLIQRGDKAIEDENQWDLGRKILIEPLLKQLELSYDKFVIVPGNHEVDIKQIVPRLEIGLQIESLQDINDIMSNFDDIYRKRLAYFYDIVKKGTNDVTFGKLGYCYKKNINDLNVGIVCIDSAWRSSGKGIIEKGKLYVGVKQIKELYYNVKECDVKICLMHHPLDWLESCEVLEIEKEMTKFDIVLRGHVHEEDLKQVLQKNLKTIYSTAGKLYPLDHSRNHIIDGFNGYSILSSEFEKGECTIYVRTYFGSNRGEFDAGINIIKDGQQTFEIFEKDNNHRIVLDIMAGISRYFHDMAEKYALIKNVYSNSPKDYLQIIVDPVLSDRSQYVKEKDKKQEFSEVNIQDIIKSDQNILLIGKKESGKTTILQQIGLKYLNNFQLQDYIPLYINMRYLPKGNNKILRSVIRFLQDNIVDESSLSKQQIIEFLNNKRIVFLVDNVNTNNVNHTVWLQQFIEQFKEKRFIFTLEEEFFQSLDIKEIPEYGIDFKEIYIQYMGKRQIRAMVTKWVQGKEEEHNIDEIVNQIDSYCNQINFAKTPFNIALFMVIWDFDNKYRPVNEGIVMRNYLEIVLEKLSPKEAYRETYSFELKQDFLSFLAHEMYLKDEYYFSHEEFQDIVIKYHKKRGYVLSKSNFNNIFFEKNILTYLENRVVFSHTSFLEYFLALYALNNADFLNEMLSVGKRSYFRNEICFYAGLKQNCIELLDELSDTIMDIIIEFIDLVDELNDLEIMMVFKIEREQLIEDIKKNRPTQDELDIVSDHSRIQEDISPTQISKRKIKTGEADNLFSLLQMYGSVIKNAEIIDNEYKIEHLENYMYGMNMLYAMLLKLSEYIINEFDFETLKDEEKVDLEIHSKEEFEESKQEMVDIIKLLFPIAIQNLILENVGTPKLEIAINELINNKQNKPFEKFMLTFLKCDLKLVNIKSLLGKYIKEEKSDGILKIVLMKLTAYYRMRFFGNNKKIDNDLIELITEIQMKLNPQKKQNFYKDLIAKDTKSQLEKNNW